MITVCARRNVIATLTIAVLGLHLAGSAGWAGGQEAPLQAGVARADITPSEPVALAGYAGRTELSKGVHDPLSARVVSFEQGGRRLVLVSTDLLGFYEGSLEAVREAIIKKNRLEPSELFLTAIHTHSGPHVSLNASKEVRSNLAYARNLGDRLAGLVAEARGREKPVALGVGSGSSPVGSNRRLPVVDRSGKTRIVLGRNPAVLTDREVQVVLVKPLGADRPSAVVFAYPTHSTSLGPKNLLISGDVHGLAELFVERYLGHGVVAPGFAGASGDIDPWFRVLPGFKSGEGWQAEPELLGAMLGEEVVSVSAGVKATATKGPIKTVWKTLALPAKSRAQEGTSPASSATMPLTVSVGRVGDAAFVGLGCEAFNAIGKAIKTGSPFAPTVVLTHCNGMGGYLPTRESYPAGGYEIDSTPFAPDAAEIVIKEVLALLHTL